MRKPYKSLLMIFIGITIGGLITYPFLGETSIYSALFLYLLLWFALMIEIHLENRK